jgi:AraC-like DNA-binding protein/quercetin dioxygenase-like cupin family protein
MDRDTATVVLVSHVRFRGGETLDPGSYSWDLLVWCTAGRGVVEVEGRELELTPESLLLVPRQTHCLYRADAADPFVLSGVHLTSSANRGRLVDTSLIPGRPVVREPLRNDPRPPGFERVRVLRPPGTDTLMGLGNAAWQYAQRDEHDPGMMSAYGRVIADAVAVGSTRLATADLPRPLRKMVDYATGNLHRPLTTAVLASVAGCSASTADRQFRAHLGVAPQVWVRTTRLAEAARLLRTERLRIGETAWRVGYTDPLYFSRQFRKHFGVTPTTYARDRVRL